MWIIEFQKNIGIIIYQIMITYIVYIIINNVFWKQAVYIAIKTGNKEIVGKNQKYGYIWAILVSIISIIIYMRGYQYIIFIGIIQPIYCMEQSQTQFNDQHGTGGREIAGAENIEILRDTKTRLQQEYLESSIKDKKNTNTGENPEENIIKMVKNTIFKDYDHQQDEQGGERMIQEQRQLREFKEYETMPDEVRMEQSIKHQKEAMIQNSLQEIKMTRIGIRNIIEEHSIMEIRKLRNDITTINQNKK